MSQVPLLKRSLGHEVFLLRCVSCMPSQFRERARVNSSRLWLIRAIFNSPFWPDDKQPISIFPKGGNNYSKRIWQKMDFPRFNCEDNIQSSSDKSSAGSVAVPSSLVVTWLGQNSVELCWFAVNQACSLSFHSEMVEFGGWVQLINGAMNVNNFYRVCSMLILTASSEQMSD